VRGGGHRREWCPDAARHDHAQALARDPGGAPVNESNTGRRLVVIGAIVMALFAGLLTRLWFLQVSGGEKLAVQAQQNRDRIVQVPALRGAIYDRNGVLLAQNVPVTTLTVDRQNLTPADRVTLEDSLSTLLNKSPVEVGQMLDDPKVSPYTPLPLITNVPYETAVYVAEHREAFPQVTITTTSVRQYTPDGVAAANVLGYTGAISADELKTHANEGYANDDRIGKTGIEQVFESELRGTPGVDKVQVDSSGRATNTVTEKKPQSGHDLQLTIDSNVQKIAAESLQQGMDGARTLVDPDNGNYYPATGGSVIVLDARTGSLVAMASGPTWDPNDFINGTADKYFADPALPLLDKGLQPYAPGSTFKLISSIAGLQSGVITPDTSVYDDGCIDLGNQKFCNARHESYGYVQLRRALTVSSDIYFYSLGNDLWRQYYKSAADGGEDGDKGTSHPVGYAIQNTARDYGMDAPTGVALPGDQKGRIPDLAFNQALNKDNSDPFSRTWRRGDSANLAVGQGDVLVTPLQLANAYATFANGGTLYTPRVVSNVLNSSVGLPPGQLGTVEHTIDPQQKHTVSLSPDVRQPILDGLDGVTHSGTAEGSFADYNGPFHVVGKTGTAEAGSKANTSWFVGIVNPENDPAQPQYVILAMVEQGGFGANVAAPIVRRVVDYLSDPSQAPAPVHIAPATGNEQSF
jgi:penicillin-binding protein 2